MSQINKTLIEHNERLVRFRHELCLPTVLLDKLTVDQIMEIKKKSLLHKSEIMTLLTSVDKLINSCDTYIEDSCVHIWVPDRASYDPCRTYYMCSKCQVQR
jgi:hypothetical protein